MFKRVVGGVLGRKEVVFGRGREMVLVIGGGGLVRVVESCVGSFCCVLSIRF